MPAAAPFKGRDGSEQRSPPRYSLTHDCVRYVGEPVALIVAETAAQAQDAAEAVAVDYEELPAVTDRAGRRSPQGAPQLHETVPGNLVLDFDGGDEAATKAAFARAAKVVTLRAYHSRVVGNPMEPRAAMGSLRSAKADQYYLHATTQGVGPMRLQVGAMLGVPPEKVRIVAEEVGGGFGVRFNAYPEYGALLLAAKKLGRPVKWVGTRSEVFVADEQARDIVHKGELALDADGRILGMRFEYLSNLGAYLAFTGSFVNTVNLVNVTSGVYDVQAVHVQAKLVLTNTVPTAAYRGAGRPVASYALERLIDEAAHEIGIDPAEFRRRNMVPKAKFPYKIVTGFEYDCGDFEGVMNKALARLGLERVLQNGRKNPQAAGQASRPRHLHLHRSDGAGGFAPYDQAHITWEKDGSITLRTASHNHGQGHETTFAQIVSAVLGVPMEKIRLRTVGARFLHDRESDRRLAHAARPGQRLSPRLARDREERHEARGGSAGERGGGPRIRFRDLQDQGNGPVDQHHSAREEIPRQARPRLHATGRRCPRPSRTAATSAEVEIDPETGETEIVAYVACDDAGNIINHQIVEGQMQGGITQGAGHIFGEQAVYDENGAAAHRQLHGLRHAARRAWSAACKVIDYPVPTATNPLGAKGVGEAGVTGSMPCLMNAVMDALRPGRRQALRHAGEPAARLEGDPRGEGGPARGAGHRAALSAGPRRA